MLYCGHVKKAGSTVHLPYLLKYLLQLPQKSQLVVQFHEVSISTYSLKKKNTVKIYAKLLLQLSSWVILFYKK